MNKKDKQTGFLNFIPRIIRYDFMRKFIALFFAILLWRSVDSQLSDHDTLTNIPVNISLPNNLQCMNIKPRRLTIKVEASRYLLNKLSSTDISVNIKDMNEEIQNNKDAFVIQHIIDTRHDIIVPPGITVVQTNPEIITINVEKRITKTVPVKLVYSGFLMRGYSYKENRLMPKQVIITGPKSLIDEIKDIETNPIILKESYVEDFECEVDLAPKEGISVGRKNVNAQIEIFKKFDTTEFANVKIKPFGLLSNKGEINITPKSVLILVNGVKEKIEIMTDKNLNPYVDISTLKVPGKYLLDVKCWTDIKDVKIKEIIPPKVTIELKQP